MADHDEGSIILVIYFSQWSYICVHNLFNSWGSIPLFCDYCIYIELSIEKRFLIDSVDPLCT